MILQVDNEGPDQTEWMYRAILAFNLHTRPEQKAYFSIAWLIFFNIVWSLKLSTLGKYLIRHDIEIFLLFSPDISCKINSFA